MRHLTPALSTEGAQLPYVLVTGEGTEVAERLWAVVAVDGVWDALWETWVAEVVFGEAPPVVNPGAAVGVEVLTLCVLRTWDRAGVGAFVVLGGAPVWLEVTVVALPARMRHMNMSRARDTGPSSLGRELTGGQRRRGWWVAGSAHPMRRGRPRARQG